MTPLFRWAGGKKRMIKEYKPHLPASFDTYVEPFFGGGALFIWAYLKNPDANFFINDINPYIMGIYESVRDKPDDFCSIVSGYEKVFLDLAPPTEKNIIVATIDGKEKKKTIWVPHPHGKTDEKLEKRFKLKGKRWNWRSIYLRKPTRRTFYFKTRQLYKEEKDKWTKTERDATLYFLLLTCFNGVWQASRDNDVFNTPCGLMRQTDKIYDRENVMEWHKALQKCTITSGDFSDTLAYIGPNSFTFLDPPYRSASKEEKTFATYNTEANDDFQEKVLDFFKKAVYNKSYTLLSNRDWGDGFFEKRVGKKNIKTFSVTYTVGRKKKDEESGKHTAKKAKEILIIGR